jgi:hypothetical protein
MNNKCLQKYDLPGRLCLHTQPFFALSLALKEDLILLTIFYSEKDKGIHGRKREMLFHESGNVYLINHNKLKFLL